MSPARYSEILFIHFVLFAKDFTDSTWIIYFGFSTQCKSPDIIISVNNNTLLLYILYYY